MTLRPSPKARAKARAKLKEPGRAEWKTPPPNGPCAGCGRRGPRMRHHGVREQDVRRLGGDPWDQRNAVLLGRYCDCHAKHHAPNGRARLPLAVLPPGVLEVAEELMGLDWAMDYLAQHYKKEDAA